MIRLVFAPYLLPNPTTTWDEYFERSATFHMLRWGKEVTGTSPDYWPIKRARLDMPDTPIYDEYLDLPSGEIDPMPAQQSTEFTDARGGSDPIQLVEGDIDQGYGQSIVNKITLEASARDWVGPTKSRLMPYPSASDPVLKVWFVNQTLEQNPSLAVNGYKSLAATWLHVSGEYSAMPPAIVPYNALTDTIRMEWYHDGGTYTGIQIYRAPVEQSEYPQQFIPWYDWENWRLLDHHRRLDITAIAVGTAGFNSATGTWLDDSLVARTLTNCFCPFIMLNNGIARMGLDWQWRNQTNQKVLLLNSDNHKYYKGYLIEVAPVFIEGPTAQSENNWQIVIHVTEEGVFAAEGWDAFITSSYFNEIDRYEEPTP